MVHMVSAAAVVPSAALNPVQAGVFSMMVLVVDGPAGTKRASGRRQVGLVVFLGPWLIGLTDSKSMWLDLVRFQNMLSG